jgi:hypothetical protein
MNRMSKLSAVLAALLFSAGAMAQSPPESSGGDTSKSDPVTVKSPADAMQKDTANSKMTNTTSNKTNKAKKAKAKPKDKSGDMSNTPSN